MESKINNIINKYLNENWKDEIKDYSKHLKDYNIKLSTKDIRDELTTLIFDGVKGESFYAELLNGQDEFDIYLSERVDMLESEVEIKDTNELIEFMDKEEEMFYNPEYIENDWITENIMDYFKWDKKDYEKYTYYCSSHQGSLHLKTQWLDSVEYWDKQYLNKNDIEEYLDNNLDFYNLMNIILMEHYRDYKTDFKEFKKDVLRAKELVKKELEKRAEESQTQINTITKELSLIDCNNTYLVDLIESDRRVYITKLNEIKESLK